MWFFIALTLGFHAHTQPVQTQALGQQLVIVQTSDWSASQGFAYRFEGRPGAWRQVGSPFEVSLGYSGLGWGRGLVDTSMRPGPRKREGDGRSPAGQFPILSSFGRGSSGWKLPHTVVTAGMECVDDAGSSFYNTFQRVPPIRERPWKSAEDLFSTEVYDFGMTIGHNQTPVKAGAGSCIFLHRWSAKRAPTPGCTAMAQRDLAMLAEWLDPQRRPMIVQLPRAEYLVLQSAWSLPALAH